MSEASALALHPDLGFEGGEVRGRIEPQLVERGSRTPEHNPRRSRPPLRDQQLGHVHVARLVVRLGLGRPPQKADGLVDLVPSLGVVRQQTLPPDPEGRIAVSLWLGRDPRIALAAPATREVA